MPVVSKSPADVIEKCAEMIQAGDLDGLLQLFDADVAFMMEPGKAEGGLDRLRAYFAPLVALRPKMDYALLSLLEADGVAQVSYRWEMTATAPDGSAIVQQGVSSDVVRRRPDGSWGVIVDNPNGGGSLVAR